MVIVRLVGGSIDNVILRRPMGHVSTNALVALVLYDTRADKSVLRLKTRPRLANS